MIAFNHKINSENQKFPMEQTKETDKRHTSYNNKSTQFAVIS